MRLLALRNLFESQVRRKGNEEVFVARRYHIILSRIRRICELTISALIAACGHSCGVDGGVCEPSNIQCISTDAECLPPTKLSLKDAFR